MSEWTRGTQLERNWDVERHGERERVVWVGGTTSPPRTNLQEAEDAEKAPQDNSAAARRVLRLETEQRSQRITMIATTQQNMTTELVCVYFLLFNSHFFFIFLFYYIQSTCVCARGCSVMCRGDFRAKGIFAHSHFLHQYPSPGQDWLCALRCGLE